MGWIKERIEAEHRKHGSMKGGVEKYNLDWALIAEKKIASELKTILFKSIKECDGETYEVDIGEYNKTIKSAHELEDIFENKLNGVKENTSESQGGKKR